MANAKEPRVKSSPNDPVSDHPAPKAPPQSSTGAGELFADAIQLHQAGRFADAESAYQQVLDLDPNHIDSLHLLGLLAYQVGRYDIAVEFVRKAIALNGGVADFHNSLGAALGGQGKLDEAVASYRRALAIRPDYAQAHNNLGTCQRVQGKLPEAVAAYKQALTLKPDYADAHYNLGNALRDQRKLDEAVASYRRALVLRPDYADAHNHLGNALRDRGKLAEAVASYRRATSLNPDLAEAHNNLGNALRDQGKLDEAVTSYRLAIGLNPDLAEAHNNLGTTLGDQGKLDEAVASYRRALALKPNYADAHNNLGKTLRDQGKLDESVASYRRALALNPDYTDAYNNLGNALRDQGKLAEAVASYRRATSLNPDLAEAHNNLGAALEDQGLLDEAVAAYQQALALEPDYADAHYNLGNALRGQGKLDVAVASYRRALALKPNLAEAQNNLGAALQEQGNLDDAAALYRRAITLRPGFAEGYYRLAGLGRLNDGSPEAEAMFALLCRQAEDLDKCAPRQASQLLFALAQALEGRDEFDRAFACLDQANAIRRADLSFNISEAEKFMASIAKVFNARFIERMKGEGLTSDRPIFIVGMPRSGTTLIEQILSSHPDVFGAGEIDNFSVLIARANEGSAFPFGAETMTSNDCRGIGQAYLDSLPADARAQRRVTDKLLHNFMLLGLIHACLPNAAIIHCLRDPRDVCLSCYGISFRKGQDYAYDLVELGRYWRAYDRLMAHWRAVLPPGRMLEVSYEAVVEDIETWARRLIDHCGLEWDDACLRFHESKRDVLTASSAQVRRPIYASSVGRWRSFAHHLGPLLEALGEPWTTSGPGVAPNA